jgi:isopenicillin-N N-acyltransferase-like protein
MLEMELKGSPYERGYQHGRQAGELVQRFHDCVLVDKANQGFRGRPQGTREDFRRRVQRVARNVGAWKPACLEELRGIADGAGMSYDDILDLNFSTEGWGELLRGCTTLVVATPDGPVVAKTEDDDEGDDAYFIFQRVIPDGGLRYIKTSMAGTLWTSIGLNEAGLTYSGSGLPLAQGTSNWNGLAPMVVNGEMLAECRTAAEAAAWMSRIDYVQHGGAFALADAEGDVIVVEKVPTQQDTRLPEDGLAFTVNDAWCPAIKPYVGGNAPLMAESHERADNLLRLARSLPATVEGMQTLLRDHTVFGGICHHGQVAIHTVSAAVAQPRQGRLWVTQGYPCQNPFVGYSV